ncbi:MAG: EutN/CcmL family microcompartment protein [Pirellulales bacterium]|nr:EutN/CcmL family microcompartment protein [Pirellulales bacterium]
MLFGQVVGNATSTTRHPSMKGRKLLVVQPLEPDGRPDGDPVLAVDVLGAGIREKVMISSDGIGTRELIGHKDTPVRWSVLGIVDP